MDENVILSTKAPASGKIDFFQALSGVFLALFTLMHGIFLGTVLISPHVMNGLGWFLEVTYLAQIGAPFILLVVVTHFLLAARKMPFNVGSLRTFYTHARTMKHSDTWLWLVQVVTAVILLVLVSIHVYTIMTNLPISAESSALREQNGWTSFYLILLTCVGLHLGIGLFRVSVKFGFITAATRSLWTQRMWALVIAYILLGLACIIRFNTLSLV